MMCLKSRVSFGARVRGYATDKIVLRSSERQVQLVHERAWFSGRTDASQFRTWVRSPQPYQKCC